MCKKLIRALKNKIDNYKLRYELAGATEIIEVLRKQIGKKDTEIKQLNVELAILRYELSKHLKGDNNE